MKSNSEIQLEGMWNLWHKENKGPERGAEVCTTETSQGDYAHPVCTELSIQLTHGHPYP